MEVFTIKWIIYKNHFLNNRVKYLMKIVKKNEKNIMISENLYTSLAKARDETNQNF